MGSRAIPEHLPPESRLISLGLSGPTARALHRLGLAEVAELASWSRRRLAAGGLGAERLDELEAALRRHALRLATELELERMESGGPRSAERPAVQAQLRMIAEQARHRPGTAPPTA